jgi:hypothetical protein
VRPNASDITHIGNGLNQGTLSADGNGNLRGVKFSDFTDDPAGRFQNQGILTEGNLRESGNEKEKEQGVFHEEDLVGTNDWFWIE